MKMIALGLSAAALAMGGVAYAQQTSTSAEANKDRVVTRAETESRAAEMFAKMDVDKDGYLTDADREAKRQERRTRMFEALDANKDGNISRDEFMASRPEAKGKPEAKSEARGERRGGRHHRMGGGRGFHGKMMESIDTDKDGKISQAEFVAASLKRFDSVDANKDGQITREERQAHREQMRGKWRQKAGNSGN